MNILLTARTAWKNIISNRLRSGLTVLGLVIGIASVILLVGMVNGATERINDEMYSVGADLVSVCIYDTESALAYDDLAPMRKLDNVSGVTPFTYLSGSVTAGGKKVSGTELMGGGESYADMMGYEMKYGRDLSRIDMDNYTKCVIIGEKISEGYWQDRNPCGLTLKIDGDDYTVVGVMKGAGSSMGSNIDNTVVMPITTSRYLGGEAGITEFYVRADSEENAEKVSKSVKQYLSKTHNLTSDYCDVTTQKMMIDAMNEMNNAMALLLGGIASISLLVGGIGVMNVMLVSVTERTREIGIRKSLGAKRKDILWQFLVESVVLSLIGGLIGILTGLLFGRIAILAGAFFSPGIGMILLAFAVSVAVGLVFGILPAFRASKMKPVEALRYE